MSNWLYLHVRAIAQALGRLAGQPVGTLLSALVMGIALSLPAGGYLLLDNVASLARGVSGTPEISVFLDTAAGKADAGFATTEYLESALVDLAFHRGEPPADVTSRAGHEERGGASSAHAKRG